jgi:predicted transcriptional regulator
MKNQPDRGGVLIHPLGKVFRAQSCEPSMKHKKLTSSNKLREIPYGVKLYQREIMYEIGFPLQPVQRELQNLLDLGIVKKVSTLNRAYYEINTSSPFFKPLREMCRFAIEQKF